MPETSKAMPEYQEPPYDPLRLQNAISEEKFSVLQEKGRSVSVGDVEWDILNQDRYKEPEKKKTLKSGDRNVQ